MYAIPIGLLAPVLSDFWRIFAASFHVNISKSNRMRREAVFLAKFANYFTQIWIKNDKSMRSTSCVVKSCE